MIDGVLESLESRHGPSRLLELGKIKIGGLGEERTSKAGKKWRLPRKDDHFTITGMARDSAGNLVVDEALMQDLQQYADPDGMLRRIPIRVLSDEVDDILQARFVWYGKKSPGAVSDGKTVTWYYDRENFGKFDPPKVEPWTPEMLDITIPTYSGGSTSLFKLHFNFSCCIAAVEARFGGIYKLRSTSIISFRQIHASLVHISQLTGGVLVGMPLFLVVRPILVNVDDKPTTVHVVHVELRGRDLQQIQEIALTQAKFKLEFKDSLLATQREYRKLLSPPGSESSEDVEFIQQEYGSVLNTEPSEARWRAIRSQYQQSLPAEANAVVCWTQWATEVTGRADSVFDPQSWTTWTVVDFLAAEDALRTQ